MALIKLDLSTPLVDGMDVKFKAPCNCDEVTGLTVEYPDEAGGLSSKEFTFRDARGYDMTGLGNLFYAGSYVKVMLDTARGHAYLLNSGACAFSVVVELLPGNWQGSTQTVQVNGVKADSMVIVSAAPNSLEAYGGNGVYCSGQADGALTFACGSVPGETVGVNILVLT